MGAICDLLESTLTRRSTTSNPSQWFIDWVSGGSKSTSGVSVSEDSALKYPPFWAAVKIISGTLAALPFKIYRRTEGDNKEPVADHPVAKLLRMRPNIYMDPVTFIESRQAHALTYGNGFAEIQRDGRGRPVALWPLLPNRTERKITDAGVPYYQIRLKTGEAIELPDYNVLHIKGLGFDGYTGYNVVTYHKEAIGAGIAVREYGARFFAGDGSPSGVLEHPSNLTKDAQERLKASWQAAHSGLSNAHRLQILEEGMKWTKTGIDPAQAQALDVQKFTVDDCSRIFNIPPHKLGSMEHATFSNIEEQNIDFVSSTLFYWFRKWEQEINYKLFLDAERDSHFCEILVDALLRGSIEARSKSFAMGRQWGYYSINDIRRILNLNTIGPAGDNYLDPLNMKPAGQTNPVRARQSATGDIRAALEDLIASTFERVVTKQSNEGGYRPGQVDWAHKILADPVRAMARAIDTTLEVDEILKRALPEFIQADIRLDDSHPTMFANHITYLLGGNHDAIAKT